MYSFSNCRFFVCSIIFHEVTWICNSNLLCKLFCFVSLQMIYQIIINLSREACLHDFWVIQLTQFDFLRVRLPKFILRAFITLPLSLSIFNDAQTVEKRYLLIPLVRRRAAYKLHLSCKPRPFFRHPGQENMNSIGPLTANFHGERRSPRKATANFINMTEVHEKVPRKLQSKRKLYDIYPLVL